MGFEDFEQKQCVCDFLNALGDVKTALTSLIDGVITILNLAKATIALWPADPADRLQLLELQTELQVLETAVAPITQPFNMIQPYLNLFGDCPGIASVAKTLTDVRNMILEPVEEYEAEVNAMIESLNLETLKIERLNNLIDQLQSVRDAIDLCGQI